jgi:hypothetical protein
LERSSPELISATMSLLLARKAFSREPSNFRILTVPSSRSLRSHSALFALNSAREREYSPAVMASMTCRSLASKLSHRPLLMPNAQAAPGSWKPG